MAKRLAKSISNYSVISFVKKYCIGDFDVPATPSNKVLISLTVLINSTSRDPKSLSMACFTVIEQFNGPGVNSALSPIIKFCRGKICTAYNIKKCTISLGVVVGGHG